MDWTIETLDEAARRGASLGDDILARSVAYDPEATTLRVDLASGASFTFPVDRVQGLSGATDQQLTEVLITGNGYGLHWPALDVDFTVRGLAAGIFGTASYMASRAGSVTSEAKAAAARTNGAGGGRPRKTTG